MWCRTIQFVSSKSSALRLPQQLLLPKALPPIVFALSGVASDFALEHHLANTDSVMLAPVTDGRWSCLHWGSAAPPFYPETAHPAESAADPMG